MKNLHKLWAYKSLSGILTAGAFEFSTRN